MLFTVLDFTHYSNNSMGDMGWMLETFIKAQITLDKSFGFMPEVCSLAEQ